MILHGREVNFRVSVGAKLELKRAYEGKTEEQLTKEYSEDAEKATEDLIRMMLVFNRAAIREGQFSLNKAENDYDYSEALTRDEILALTDAEFSALADELTEAKKEGEKITVFAKAEKKTVGE